MPDKLRRLSLKYTRQDYFLFYNSQPTEHETLLSPVSEIKYAVVICKCLYKTKLYQLKTAMGKCQIHFLTTFFHLLPFLLKKH